MDITICDNLKELRKKKNNTQEDLAEFLTISIAAVSKWERGESYPDIELLPRIAVFYDTTVDDLLGVGEARKKHKINEYSRQTGEFWKTGDSLGCLELWRNAAKEFPNDNYVMWQFMQALTNFTGWLSFADDKEANDAKKNEYLKEAVEIGEALSAKTNDQTTIYYAICRLCRAYKALGEVEKAVNTANKLPEAWLSREESLVYLLEGAELKAHTQKFLLSLIGSINNAILNLRRCDCDYDNGQIMRIYEKAIQMIKLFFEDGDYGAQHYTLRSLYLAIAQTCAKMNDADAVIENLSSAAKHAIAYDLLEEDVPYTSLLFNTQKTQRHGKTYMSNESQSVLTNMATKQFDFCRDDERFAEIKNKLMTVSCEDINSR
jgi:transcriptional regulator with XRE-family HTH domain